MITIFLDATFPPNFRQSSFAHKPNSSSQALWDRGFPGTTYSLAQMEVECQQTLLLFHTVFFHMVFLKIIIAFIKKRNYYRNGIEIIDYKRHQL